MSITTPLPRETGPELGSRIIVSNLRVALAHARRRADETTGDARRAWRDRCVDIDALIVRVERAIEVEAAS